MADQDAERDRDQDLNIEDLVPGLTPGGGTDRFCGHGRLAWGEKELAAMMGDRRAADNELAKAFADYMQGGDARKLMVHYGFALPGEAPH